MYKVLLMRPGFSKFSEVWIMGVGMYQLTIWWISRAGWTVRSDIL